MISTERKNDPFAALRYKDFRMYLAINFFFTLAYQMQTVVLGFFIYQITHSTFALGILGLSEAMPALAAALYGGFLADKSEKRQMLIYICSVVLFSSPMLLLISLRITALYVQLNHIVLFVYGMICLNGTARAFFYPAAYTIYADSILHKDYANGTTWNNAFKRIAYIVGPAAGGLIYAFAGITVSFYIIVTTILISRVFVFHLKRFPPVFASDEKIWSSLNNGLRFVCKIK